MLVNFKSPIINFYVYNHVYKEVNDTVLFNFSLMKMIYIGQHFKSVI
jgi:hypothetical protein